MDERVIADTAHLLARERDLYRGLLELSSELDPAPFLKNALELIVGVLGASHGYLELYDDEHQGAGDWYAVGFPDAGIEQVRTLVSHGIIAEAVATEQVVTTPSALLDPRFRDRASVRQSRIDAVTCAPIGTDPPRGVLYVQSKPAPSHVLVEQSRQVERFARYLAPIADRVVLRRRAQRTTEIAGVRAKLRADELIGSGRAVTRLLREVQAVAHLDVSVLLSGETGTGKSQLARLIHQNSQRLTGPFLEVNCATLPDTLLENELFGALQGAHSTASRRIDGKVAAAAGGTLFLDEIAELSLPAQAKILQLLQSKEYSPLGSARVHTANVRIIAASNLDLKQAVADRRFRQDLFYRLQVVSIRLPGLDERTEDVAPLSRFFCDRAQKLHGLPSLSLSQAALRALENTVWPGHVRELSNVIEAATIRAASEGVRQVEVSHLFPNDAGSLEGPSTLTFQEQTRRFQAEMVRKMLEACDWNVSAAARRLELTRAHLYNLIKSFGLRR